MGEKNQYNDNVRYILVKQKIKLHNLLTDLSSKTFFDMNVVDKIFFFLISRCLEYQNILPRRKGWQFQRPNREYYYK